MKSFLLKVGSNRLLRSQTLRVSFKKPWDFLAETNLAVSATASVLEQNSVWWRRGELNPCPRRYPRKHLHVYPMRFLRSRRCIGTLPTSERPRISFTVRRGHSADRLACCPRLAS